MINDEEILSSKEVIVKVFDISGKVILTTKSAPATYLPVTCSGFKPGIYIVMIQGGNKTEQTKVVVQ
jgi:hypothetical protein